MIDPIAEAYIGVNDKGEYSLDVISIRNGYRIHRWWLLNGDRRVNHWKGIE